MRALFRICLVLSVASCASTDASSTAGGKATGGAPPVGTSGSLEADLAAAQAAWEAAPESEGAAIWVGRRLGYLGRYREAIDWYTARLAEHPDSFRLLRHRGHRYISVREFGAAVSDLEQAASLIADVPDEIEPDGAPNEHGIPRSTNHSNIYYHLGLAHYLSGDYDAALVAYEHGMTFSRVNDDMLVATTNWLYATLRRLGLDRRAAATLEPIGRDMDLLENYTYWKLLLLNKGDLTLEELTEDSGDAILSATLAYGIGNFHYMRGDTDRAMRVWSELANSGAQAAFGTIAAQADLARLSGL